MGMHAAQSSPPVTGGPTVCSHPPTRIKAPGQKTRTCLSNAGEGRAIMIFDLVFPISWHPLDCSEIWVFFQFLYACWQSFWLTENGSFDAIGSANVPKIQQFIAAVPVGQDAIVDHGLYSSLKAACSSTVFFPSTKLQSRQVLPRQHHDWLPTRYGRR